MHVTYVAKKQPKTLSYHQYIFGKLIPTLICHKVMWCLSYNVIFNHLMSLSKFNMESVAALSIDKVGPRPYHFRSGPTTGPQEA